MSLEQNAIDGAKNLLINCADLKSDETLLIISEDPQYGWYDRAAANVVAEQAAQMGITPTRINVGEPGNTADPVVDAAIKAHDCTIYFARIGDQDRFGNLAPGKKSVMSYIRDVEMLGSAYGRTHYGATIELKEAVNDILLSAENIKITCPAGTNVEGHASSSAREQKTDVSVLRFPLGVPLPMEATEFSGQVAITRFITPTGSKIYHPASVSLEGTVTAKFTNGRIDGFSGESQRDVIRSEDHYAMVARTFKIDPDVVHSWHAGIHPGCDSNHPAEADPDRWSNTVFTNPRVLHFHTCGAYAPGEICWMIFDHTVCVDGINLWEDGRLLPQAFAQTRTCLENWPELTALCDNPAQGIGI